jgi:hypothetical protein
MSKRFFLFITKFLAYTGVVIITLPGTHLIAQTNGFDVVPKSPQYISFLNQDSVVAKIYTPVTSDNLQGSELNLSAEHIQIYEAAIEAEKLIAYYFKKDDFKSSIIEHFKGKDRQKDVQWIKNVETIKQKILNEKFNINIKSGTSAELNYRLSKLTYTTDNHAINILLNAEWLGYGMKTEAITKAILEETGKVIEHILYNDTYIKQHQENDFAEYLMGVYFGA